jgi:hypothetical protein
MAKMPKAKGWGEDIFFCLNNAGEFATEFGAQGTTGTATVVIDNYSVILRDADVFNTATLVDVVEVTLPAPNEFDLLTAQVGDEVMGMEIVELETPGNGQYYPSEITFKGQAEVTGDYTYHEESDAFLAGSVCLRNLTQESLEKLPTIMGTSADNIWFCFKNEEAQAEFGPQGSTGTATVVIDDYYIPLIESEVWKMATLVEVVEKD